MFGEPIDEVSALYVYPSKQLLFNIFRDKLGLQENDSVNISGVLIKYKKQKKALQHAQLKVSKLEDENVALKLNVQELNRKNSNLSKGGGKADAENALGKGVDKLNESADVDLKALSEENEALRKGLHEILDGLKQKRKGVKFEYYKSHMM